jgi:integrase
MGRGGQLSGSSKLSDLAAVYQTEIEPNDRSPSIIARYKDRLDRQILPALADVRLRELSVGRVDAFLQQVRKSRGAATARMTRSVLSGMCALAARRDAMQFNPVRDTTPIKAKPKNPAQPLDASEPGELRRSLLTSDLAHELDVADLVLFMIATGCRIGEALAPVGGRASHLAVGRDPDHCHPREGSGHFDQNLAQDVQ